MSPSRFANWLHSWRRITRSGSGRSRARPLSFDALENRVVPTLTVDFDWRMADRFGIDENDNGWIDLPNSAAYAQANTFQVFFNVTPSAPIRGFHWQVTDLFTGAAMPTPSGPLLTTVPGHIFLDDLPEGVYTVKLTAESDTETASVTHTVVVKDFVLVGLGDSYASGEGNPEWPSPVASSVVWADGQEDSFQAHRSTKAAIARAALALEQADPRTSVSLVFVAASGAAVGNLLSTGRTQGAREGGPNLTLQIPRAAEIVGNRQVDALYMSIGGNDVGFSNVIEELASPPPFAESKGNILATFVGPGLDRLGGSLYPALDTDLRTQLHVSDIYISEYPDPTRDGRGLTCDELLGDAPLPVLSIDHDDLDWVRDNVIVPLNDRVAASASQFGWHFIGGVSAAYHTHGYCATSPYGLGDPDPLDADDINALIAGYLSPPANAPSNTDPHRIRWVRTWQESLILQGISNHEQPTLGIGAHADGVVHPNEFGHDRGYKPQILRAFDLSTHLVRSTGQLLVAGTGNDDTISVGFTGTKIRVVVNGRSHEYAPTDVKGVYIDGLRGHDTLELNLLGGDPNLPLGIFVEGGGDVDEVRVLGDVPFGTITHTLTGPHAGSVNVFRDATYNGRVFNTTIHYTNIVQVTDAVDIPHKRAFNIAIPGDQRIVLGGTGPTGGVHWLNDDGTDTFPRIAFGRVNTTAGGCLEVDAGDGDDTIIIDTADPTFRDDNPCIVLHGGEGRDTLDGGNANATLDGGPDVDQVRETANGFILAPGRLQRGRTGLALDVFLLAVDAVHTLTSIEEVDLTGDADRNLLDAFAYHQPVTLRGGAGNDIFYGGSGDTLLEGGDHNDLYFVSPNNLLSADPNDPGEISPRVGEGSTRKTTVTDRAGDDTLNMSLATKAALLDLDRTFADQTVAEGLKLRLEGQIENFVGTPHGDTIAAGVLDVPRRLDGGPHGVSAPTDVLVVDAAGAVVLAVGSPLEVAGYAKVSYSRFGSVEVVNKDVTAFVTVARGGAIFNRRTGQWSQRVTITNTASVPLRGPISLILEALANGVTLVNATDVTRRRRPGGKPYIDVLGGGELAPGQAVSVTLEFTLSYGATLSWTPRVIAGPGIR